MEGVAVGVAVGVGVGVGVGVRVGVGVGVAVGVGVGVGVGSLVKEHVTFSPAATLTKAVALPKSVADPLVQTIFVSDQPAGIGPSCTVVMPAGAPKKVELGWVPSSMS